MVPRDPKDPAAAALHGRRRPHHENDRAGGRCCWRQGFRSRQSGRRHLRKLLLGFSRTTANMKMAEGVGFEPTREQNPLPVFKTGALNHSATLPSLVKSSAYIHS